MAKKFNYEEWYARLEKIKDELDVLIAEHREADTKEETGVLFAITNPKLRTVPTTIYGQGELVFLCYMSILWGTGLHDEEKLKQLGQRALALYEEENYYGKEI